MQSIVRQAEPPDVAAVRECILAAFSPYISRIGKPPAPMLLDFDAHVRDQHVWVSDSDGRIGGVLIQYETPEGFYIDTVSAFPQQQGSGIGKALLTFAEAEAIRRGYTSLYLCTNSKMIENQILYSKIGYVEYERKPVGGYDRIYYRKTLASKPRDA